MALIGTVDAPINEQGEATEKETPQETGGTESVASESGQPEQDRAGGSQDSAEGGQVEGQPNRQRGPSKLDTIRELRAKLRDQRTAFDSEVGSIRTQLDEMKAMIAARGGDKKPSKTFWEAPEEVLDERFSNQSKTLKEEILQEIRQGREQDQTTSTWKQETSEAAKFIQGQKGMTREDHEDIAEIIRSTPAMANMRPQERADYALFLWQKEKGIGDRSGLKARASTTVGAPPAAGGQKTWTEAEVEAKIASYPRDPKHWTPDQVREFDNFERELRLATQEGRVK